MELLVLVGLGALGVSYLNTADTNRGTQIQTTTSPGGFGEGMQNEVNTYKSIEPKFDRNLFDLNEAGMVYGIEKPKLLNVTNLNEAYKPWSAPDQKPVRSIPEFMANQAISQAYLEATGHAFYFNKNGEIPLASAQQSNPNVEIPGGESIRWDPEASLSTYPRVYVSSGEEVRKPTSEYEDHFLQAFQPTEMEMRRVQDEGRLNRDHNPWGPGGHYQRIFNSNHEEETRRRGVDRSTILTPVIGASFYH